MTILCSEPSNAGVSSHDLASENAGMRLEMSQMVDAHRVEVEALQHEISERDLEISSLREAAEKWEKLAEFFNSL